MFDAKKGKEKKTFFVAFVLYHYAAHQGVYYFTVSFQHINATDFPKDLIRKRTFKKENAEDTPKFS